MKNFKKYEFNSFMNYHNGKEMRKIQTFLTFKIVLELAKN